jgi:hypothetical protein
MTRGYKETDWPTSKRRRDPDLWPQPPQRKRRKPPTSTPIEEWIEKDKRKELERPFDDPLPF